PRSEVVQCNGRRRRFENVQIVRCHLEQNGLDLTRIAAVGDADWNGDAPDIVAERPVLHLLGDEIGVWDKNMRPVECFKLGRAHADFAHIALLTADDYQIADTNWPFREQNETRDKIVDEILQTETNADGERAGNDGNIGQAESGI